MEPGQRPPPIRVYPHTRRPAMPPRAALALVAVAALGSPAAALPTDAPETGTVRVESDGAAGGVPERYRLTARTFEYTLVPRFRLRHSGVDVYDLTFPSPVSSGI